MEEADLKAMWLVGFPLKNRFDHSGFSFVLAKREEISNLDAGIGSYLQVLFYPRLLRRTGGKIRGILPFNPPSFVVSFLLASRFSLLALGKSHSRSRTILHFAHSIIWRQIGDKIDTQISWPWKHFFASKIVLRVIVCCLRGVGSMSSSRRIPRFIVVFLRGTAGSSSWRHFYVFLSSDLLLDCVTYIAPTLLTLLLCMLPYCSVPLLLCCHFLNFSIFLHDKSQFFFPYRRVYFFFWGGGGEVRSWFMVCITNPSSFRVIISNQL